MAAGSHKMHQVFVGCPFRRNIRDLYDRLKGDIEGSTPLLLVLADTGEMSSKDYLLQHITGLITESAACMFDATGGNPNVSLEVGIAHALPADYLLCFSTRKVRSTSEQQAERAAMSEGEVRPIIADLQGKNRVEYKSYKSLKEQVIRRYLSRLPFMHRWNQFQSEHRSMVPFAIELFDEIRGSGRSQRARLTAILEGSGFDATEVAEALVRAKLLVSKQGRGGGYFYPAR